MSNLSALTSLSITNVDGWGKMPGCIVTLTTLRHLEIDMDDIVTLPEQIGRLQQLRVLKLSKYVTLCGQVTQLGRLKRIEGVGSQWADDDDEHAAAHDELARRGVELWSYRRSLPPPRD
jgi:hypothetical protein